MINDILFCVFSDLSMFLVWYVDVSKNNNNNVAKYKILYQSVKALTNS